MIDPTSFEGKPKYLYGKSLGRQCINRKSIRKLDLCLPAACLRAAPFAGLELWGLRRDQIPFMWPIAWKEFVAFTGSVMGIWGVKIAYFSLFTSKSHNFFSIFFPFFLCKGACEHPLKLLLTTPLVDIPYAPSRLGTSPCAFGPFPPRDARCMK